MADAPYFELLKKSFRQLFDNWVLLLVVLVSLGLFLGCAIVLGIEAGILFMLNRDAILAVLSQPELLPDSLLGLLNAQNAVLLVLFFILDIVMLIAASAYVASMKIGMYKEIVDTGKTSSQNMLSYGRRFFGVYFGVIVIRALLFLVPMAVLGGIAFAALAASPVLGALVIVLFMLLLIAYALFLGFALFFVDPMIVSRKGSAKELVKASFAYLKANPWHVIATWGIVVVISILVSSVFSALSSMAGATYGGTVSIGIVVFFGILSALANIIVSFGTGLFVFNSYFYNPRKK